MTDEAFESGTGMVIRCMSTSRILFCFSTVPPIMPRKAPVLECVDGGCVTLSWQAAEPATANYVVEACPNEEWETAKQVAMDELANGRVVCIIEAVHPEITTPVRVIARNEVSKGRLYIGYTEGLG